MFDSNLLLTKFGPGSWALVSGFIPSPIYHVRTEMRQSLVLNNSDSWSELFTVQIERSHSSNYLVVICEKTNLSLTFSVDRKIPILGFHRETGQASFPTRRWMDAWVVIFLSPLNTYDVHHNSASTRQSPMDERWVPTRRIFVLEGQADCQSSVWQNFFLTKNKGILDCPFCAPVSRIFMVDAPCRLAPLLAIPEWIKHN